MTTHPNEYRQRHQRNVTSVHSPLSQSGRRDTGIKLDLGSVRSAGVILVTLTAALLLGLWLFAATRHFLFLILLAWLFAAALEPGIRALITRGLPRGISAAIVGGGTLLVGLLLAIVFGKLFFDQITSLVNSLPETASSLIKWANDRFGIKVDATNLTSQLNLSLTNIQTWARTLSAGVLSVVGSLASVVFDLLTVLVFGFYFAGNGPTYFRALATRMNPRRQKVFVHVTDIATKKTGGYIASKIALAGLSTFFHGIFFAVIGVPYWLPLALLVGVISQSVPLIGTFIGVALPLLATVFVSPWKAIAVIAFATVYQQVENYLFTPRVSARTMDVSPAMALAAVFLGAAIWGPLGALIGIPLAAAGVSILQTYQQAYDLVPEAAAHVADTSNDHPDPETEASPSPLAPASVEPGNSHRDA